MHLNLLTPAQSNISWAHIRSRARLANSYTKDAKAEALRAACLDMAAEQRADGIARGMVVCDLPWCGCAATHRWVRTAKELKAMERKHKGQTLKGEAVETLCEAHVPSWRVGQFARLVQNVRLAA